MKRKIKIIGLSMSLGISTVCYGFFLFSNLHEENKNQMQEVNILMNKKEVKSLSNTEEFDPFTLENEVDDTETNNEFIDKMYSQKEHERIIKEIEEEALAEYQKQEEQRKKEVQSSLEQYLKLKEEKDKLDKYLEIKKQNEKKQNEKKQIQEKKLNSTIIKTISSNTNTNTNTTKPLYISPNNKNMVAVLYHQAGKKIPMEEIQFIYNESKKKNIPASLLLELFRRESTFNNDAVGSLVRRSNGKTTHAIGIAQIMPDDTGPWLAKISGIQWDLNKLKDIKYSTILATSYLEYLYFGDGEKFNGYHDWHKTLTAYNRGIGGLKKYIANNGTAVSKYSSSILNKTLSMQN